MQDVAALKCKGRPNLIQGSGMSVVQMLDDPEIDYSYSAILEERERSNPTCTAAEDCTVSNLTKTAVLRNCVEDGFVSGGAKLLSIHKGWENKDETITSSNIITIPYLYQF